MPTSYNENNLIYTTKALRSVSNQGHLQPHCHSKARSLSKQLYNGQFSHSDILLQNVEFRNSSYRSYPRFDMQTRRKGKFCFVLTLSPRLYAFLNKRIFDSRLNSNISYSSFPHAQNFRFSNFWRNLFS